MLLLAWYTVVLSVLAVVATIANSENNGPTRLISVIFNLPVVLFALSYLFK